VAPDTAAGLINAQSPCTILGRHFQGGFSGTATQGRKLSALGCSVGPFHGQERASAL